MISEFLAGNINGPEDRDGNHSPWIEFYNDGNEPVDLSNWYLTNDPDDMSYWRIPRTVVPVRGYALIHASGKDENNSLFNAEIHSSFSLSLGIDYLGLVQPDGTTVVSEYKNIPRQRAGYSYGMFESALATYLGSPSPLESNRNPVAGFADAPVFSVKRGFHEEPFEVEITSKTEGATIIYTTSGREPSKGTLFTGPIEHVYDGPVQIEETTVLRAAAFKDGLGSSGPRSQTYIFIPDVIQQSTLRTSITESATFGPRMREALEAVPSISLAVDDLDLVAKGTSSTNDVESKVSMEWLEPGNNDGFQINAGISRFGGYYTNFQKKSFRLYFRKRYGEGQLKYPLFRGFERGRAPVEEFDSLNLRSGSHDMNQRGAYMSNRYVDDALLEMGGMAPHGRFVHVYLNGIYWGQYHLRERWNAAMFASYFGGREEDYDAINKNDNFTNDFKAYDGDTDYWLKIESLARDGTPWTDLQPHVNLKDFHDFMLLWSTGHSESEFQAVGSESLGVPFHFYMKDADGWLWGWRKNLESNRITHQGPGSFLGRLRAEGHIDYRMFFADRIHKHYFNDGALTPARNIERLQARVDETEASFIAESARWGFHTPASWRRYQDALMKDHFPQLTDDMIKIFKQRGVYPEGIASPTFSQHGGEIEPGHVLTMRAGTLFQPQDGDFLYTTDGTDPRMPGGLQSETALVYERNGPGIALDRTVKIKARTFVSSLFNNGTWSALNEAIFHVGKRPEPGDLLISEIHYRPTKPNARETAAGFDSRGQFEFIELYNASDATVSLHDVVFANGVRFAFSEAATESLSLAPGEVAVLARNPDAFAFRYGESIFLAGSYAGSKLSDDGESIRLTTSDGAVLLEMTYNDAAPWPEEADGDGPSLSLVDPTGDNDLSDPARWRASAVDGGTPGTVETADPLPVDADKDGLSALLEMAIGTSDADPADGPGAFTLAREEVGVDGETTTYWMCGISRNPAIHNVVLELEKSENLENWKPAEDDFELIDSGDADLLQWRSRKRARDLAANPLYLRVKARRTEQ